MEIVANEQELQKVVKAVLRTKKTIILLYGDLGSGKTTFVKAFAKALGEEGVSSPTFSLQQIYGNKIFHYDLYQGGSEKFLELGLLEELEKDGFHLIEWSDDKLETLLKNVGFDFIKLFIEPKGAKRLYRICDA